MTLTVETGAGLTNAESYVSVADADTYVAAHGADATWTAGAPAAKETALRIATQYIDSKYSNRWLGRKASGTQALSWPRSEVYVDDYLLSASSLPNKLVEATVEVAIRAIAGSLLSDVTSPGMIAETEVKVDVITERVKYVGGAEQQTEYPIVEMLLKQLLGNNLLSRA